MYLVIDNNSIRDDRSDIYSNVSKFDVLTKAESYAKRKAAKNYGISEYSVFQKVSETKTDMPSEVSVTTIN